MYKRRADLVGFVNGMPLMLHRTEEVAREAGERLQGQPQRLQGHHPAAVLVQRASSSCPTAARAKMGSITAGWEHFCEWKRINERGRAGRRLAGDDDPGHVRARPGCWTWWRTSRSSRKPKGGLVKVVAKNHQYLGVNNAIDAVREIKENQGRLGVFWHTQGSGKSFSMVFFSQKVLRKVPGNWTFVIVTDRNELDDQIYKNFADAGAVTEEESRQAESGEHLKQLLTEDHRYVFTLIQKFRTETGRDVSRSCPTASDIIVITDEAHRTQYDTFALNMRNALPNAAFIGFTGTPLMAGEEKTKRGLRRLRQHLQLPAVGGGRGDGAALLREPHPRTAADQRALERGHGPR